MNKTIFLTVLFSLAVGALGGYWFTSQYTHPAISASAPQEKKVLYYRAPMNPAVTSPVATKDEMGMDYVPVYEESPSNTETAKANTVTNQENSSERKVLYYRNPMGLKDTSSIPKKDSMGMDYIPVYAEDNQSTAHETNNNAKTLHISTEKVQRLGVKTVLVENTEIKHTVRSVGTVETDERQLYNVTLRFDGFIEKLYVNTTGQSVARGQPLFALYSPDLVSAQQEYLTAKNGQITLNKSEDWVQAGMQSLTEGSLERLRNWGISEAELTAITKQGKIQHTLMVRSPASGIVMEKSAVAGARVMAGDTLFKIADLSTVWVIAEVYEQDIGLIKLGQTVRTMLDAYPDHIIQGKVEFIYPTLNPSTRTVKVRIALPNPDGLLKPMLYARMEIDTQVHRALAVPSSAVLESGRRTMVLVDLGEGRFEPRAVSIGTRGDDKIEILEGLHAHEQVVVSANFLIDSESNLKAALGSFDAQGEHAGSNTQADEQSAREHQHSGGL